MLIRRNKQRIAMVIILYMIMITALYVFGFYTHKLATRNKSLEQSNAELTENLEVLQYDKELLEYKVSVLTDSVQEVSEQNNQLNMELEELKQKNAKRMVYLGEFTVTYYCIEDYPHICGTEKRQTASGELATPGITVAVDPKVISMYSELYIAGVGVRVAQDTGGAIKGNRIDICVATHAEALKLGVKKLQVWKLL